MANLSKTTQDHDEIRRWAEERGAHPACVKGTGDSGDVGLLRLDFPGYSGGDSLQEISWDEFFEKFDELKLSLLYQEETSDGERSNFNKIVSAETASAAQESGHRKRGSTKKAVAHSTSTGPGVAKSTKTVAPVKKTAAKKTALPAKKTAPAKKTVAKVAAKKAVAATKKTAFKKAAPQKTVKKAAAKKNVAKKALKKVAAKKTVAKKTTAKKTAAKKSTRGRR